MSQQSSNPGISERYADVISNLRAIIISCKGGLPLSDVQNDYMEAFGERVPYKEMEYKSLREMFEKNPTEFYVFGDKVDVVTKATSAHIKSLVNRQKGKPRATRSLGSSFNTSISSSARRRPIQSSSSSSSSYQPSYTSSYPPPPRRPSRLGKEQSVAAIKELVKKQLKFDTPDRSARKPKTDSSTDSSKPTSSQNTEKKTPSTPSVTSAASAPSASTVSSASSTSSAPSTPLTPSAPSALSAPSAPKRDAESSSPSVTTVKNVGETGAKVTSFTAQSDDTFDNIRDLPPTLGAQSRLLRYKQRVSQDKMEERSTMSSGPFGAENMYFDARNIPPAPAPQVNFFNREYISVATQNQLDKNYTNQKAQARITLLKRTMQTFVENMKFPSEKFENGETGNRGLQIETSVNQSSTFVNKEPVHNVLQKTNDKKIKVATDNAVYEKKLKELCNARGFLDPSYKIIVREPKNEQKKYICKVQIEDYLQMSSYPIETRDPLSAKELAAKKMYNYCVTDETFRKKNDDEEVIIPRILELVRSTYGVWSDKLPMLYCNMYKEELSSDWFDIISKSPSFEIENFDSERCIVRKKAERAMVKLDSLQKFKDIKIRESASRNLPDLNLPAAAHWEVYVTNVNNSSEIYCRLIGEKYSDAYDAMMTKLELEPPRQKVEKPITGGLYIVQISGAWYRIKLVELVNDSQALVLFIDIGDRDVVKLSDLYEPLEHYFSVAPQAISFSLYELGSFADDDELTTFMINSILGNTYIAEIIPDARNNVRSVRLWDTTTERDINVNHVLLNNIIKNITIPALPNKSQIKEVTVTAVSENGDIYVQTNQKNVHRLNCIILNKIHSMKNEPERRKTDDTIGTETLYLTKSIHSGIFCRVRLTEIQSVSTVDVFFIDYGFVQRRPVSDLVVLDKTSILQAIPAQAIRVKLEKVTLISQNVVAELRQTILNQNVLMKVISINDCILPSVEFFKRSDTGNSLYSVNMKIRNEPQLRDSDIVPRRKSGVVGLESVLPKTLPAPELPDVGRHFEVFVTFASSPDLFIVQPLTTRMHLMEMMNELQKMTCENYPSHLRNEVLLGELYAVLHPDGNWYRGCSQAIVGFNNYTIYLCDFGDCIMVTRDKLVPLPEKFKTFPYQAIRATLVGIPPELRDWTPIDCINFHRLVVEKRFVSTVMEITRDERNPNYVNLGLILTDTTKEKDVYIHKVLMENRNEGSLVEL